jgi:hypothetical protein
VNEDETLEFLMQSMTELTGKISAEFAKQQTNFVTANAVALETVAAQAAASSAATWLAIRASIRAGGN